MNTPHDKHIIYQLFVRYFTNYVTNNSYLGSIETNGCGKFNDITHLALKELKKFGISHIWFTGIIEHATLTDYSNYGILKNNPQIVKGIAGSPYAIKDYYDVDPDLAENVPNRMSEFEALVHRTHEEGMKVIIDFIPNHVAREYLSDQLEDRSKDFGYTDHKTIAFSPNNNFYYLPNQEFITPETVSNESNYVEFPAKATGNDIFSNAPSIYDWYETIKLNYGIDYLNGHTKHFEPIPSTWLKMRDILLFWREKGIDGFRCDMAEMVPIEFWKWVINEIKVKHPDTIFIAEIYNPSLYTHFIKIGGFDYLYDKVGLYDSVRRLIEGYGNAADITHVWQNESGEIANSMLRFLENHDEQRIASKDFAGDANKALAGMVLSATLHTGPLMIYNGQEVGVNANATEGFQGNDGRSSIFDYWGIPELQAWTNNGKFDGAKLTPEQKLLREFYRQINSFCTSNEAIYEGKFYDLQYINHNDITIGYEGHRHFSYVRYTPHQKLIGIFNFNHNYSAKFDLNILPKIWKNELGISTNKPYHIESKFTNDKSFTEYKTTKTGHTISIHLSPNSFVFFEVNQ